MNIYKYYVRVYIYIYIIPPRCRVLSTHSPKLDTVLSTSVDDHNHSWLFQATQASSNAAFCPKAPRRPSQRPHGQQNTAVLVAAVYHSPPIVSQSYQIFLLNSSNHSPLQGMKTLRLTTHYTSLSKRGISTNTDRSCRSISQNPNLCVPLVSKAKSPSRTHSSLSRCLTRP